MKKLLDIIRSWFSKPKLEPEPIVPTHTSFAHKPSTKIVVYVDDKIVGAVQSLTVTEIRRTDIPSPPACEVTAHRIRFDKARIAEAFSRGFVHANAQRHPLQIHIIEDDVITTIQNAWIKEMPFSYTTVNWIIVDEMILDAETIFSNKKD